MPLLLALALAPAVAADIAWACGVVSEPADALPWAYTSEGVGGEAAGDDTMSEILVRVDDDCVADCDDPYRDCPAGTCTSAAGDVVSWGTAGEVLDDDTTSSSLTVRVEPPADAGV